MKKRLAALVLAALAGFSTTAHAAPLLQIEAISQRLVYKDFSIVFEDLDGDRLLSANELVSFSGFTSVDLASGFTTFYSEIFRVPILAGVADGRIGDAFVFSNPERTRYITPFPGNFEFSISSYVPPVSGVPLPASFWLLAAGLCGLAFLCRNRGLSRRRHLLAH